MQREDLTREQIEAIQAKIVAQLAYVGRLHMHMLRAGFPTTDKTFQLVAAAHDAIHRLRIDLHYLECDRFRRDRGAAKK